MKSSMNCSPLFLRMTICVTGFISANSDCIFAQALIQRLPMDGTSATYEHAGEHFDLSNGTQKFTCQLTVRCVGTEHFGMQAYRWIEFDQDAIFNEQKYRTIYKVLIAEDAITEAKEPLAKVKRGWQAYGPDDDNLTVVEIESTDVIRAMLNTFIVPALKDTVKLPAKQIVLGDRKLKCAGLSGVYEFTDDRKRLQSRKYTIYTHASSPFGSVRCQYQYESESNGIIQFRTKGDYLLINHGKNAESALPDYK